MGNFKFSRFEYEYESNFVQSLEIDFSNNGKFYIKELEEQLGELDFRSILDSIKSFSTNIIFKIYPLEAHPIIIQKLTNDDIKSIPDWVFNCPNNSRLFYDYYFSVRKYEAIIKLAFTSFLSNLDLKNALEILNSILTELLLNVSFFETTFIKFENDKSKRIIDKYEEQTIDYLKNLRNQFQQVAFVKTHKKSLSNISFSSDDYLNTEKDSLELLVKYSKNLNEFWISNNANIAITYFNEHKEFALIKSSKTFKNPPQFNLKCAAFIHKLIEKKWVNPNLAARNKVNYLNSIFKIDIKDHKVFSVNREVFEQKYDDLLELFDDLPFAPNSHNLKL
jgi:hypothetical protein